MYETPTLAVAGKIADVVLGIAALGGDLDGSLVPDSEFLEDDDFNPSLS